jgi:hypothetical protein
MDEGAKKIKQSYLLAQSISGLCVVKIFLNHCSLQHSHKQSKVGPRGVLCFFLGIALVMYHRVHSVGFNTVTPPPPHPSPVAECVCTLCFCSCCFVVVSCMCVYVCVCFHLLVPFHLNQIFGILLEMFGFLNLFGNFFPVVISWARHMPVMFCYHKLKFCN